MFVPLYSPKLSVLIDCFVVIRMEVLIGLFRFVNVTNLWVIETNASANSSCI